MSFHQVSQGLRLKGSQTRITNLPVMPKKKLRISKSLQPEMLLYKCREEETYAQASKSPLLIDSINCSVTLMISCLRATTEDQRTSSTTQTNVKNKKIKLRAVTVFQANVGLSAGKGNLTPNQLQMDSSLRFSWIFFQSYQKWKALGKKNKVFHKIVVR